MTGGKNSKQGTNLYMNRFLKHWRGTGRGKVYRAHVVS
jgi:RNA-directed DNA polymerase